MRVYFRFIGVLVISLLGGCASAPPQMKEIQNKPLEIPVSKIIIANLEVEEKYDKYAGVWASGFIPLDKSASSPPFNEYLINSLKKSLKPQELNQASSLEISILRASLMMEVRIADSVAFVGILSALAERQYMCKVDVNYRFGDSSTRKSFEVIDKRGRGWGDLATEDKEILINRCTLDLIKKIYDQALILR